MGSGVNAVVLPSKVIITRGPGFTEISWRWSEQVSKKAFFGPMSGLAIAASQGMQHGLVAAGIVIGTAALASGLALIGYNKNVVTVRASQGLLTVTSKPLGVTSISIAADDIASIEVRQRKMGKRALARQKPDAENWGVVLVRKSGKVKDIVSSMMKREQATALAELIAQALAGE
jgi:hypothetical protein